MCFKWHQIQYNPVLELVLLLLLQLLLLNPGFSSRIYPMLVTFYFQLPGQGLLGSRT